MRTLVLVAALALATDAVARRPATVTASAMACRDAAVLRTIIDQLKTKDDNGFQDAMVAAMSSGKCLVLEPGTAVDADDASAKDGLVKVRSRAAKVGELWILQRALE